MAEGLRDRLCHIWRRQLGPFLYRKMQRVCCMGRTILITSQFLQFLRQSTAKYNATYRSDIQTINTAGAQGADNRFFLSVVQRTMQSLALQCAPRGDAEQQELTWTNLQVHCTSLRVGLLGTSNVGMFPRPHYKGNPQPPCTATFIPTTSL